MNIHLERIENEAFTGQSKVLRCHLPTGTEESHEKSVRIVCVLAKTENKHLWNTKCYCFRQHAWYVYLWDKYLLIESIFSGYIV